MNFKSLAIVLVSVLFASGCAQMNKQAFNKDANVSLKSIAISQPQIQDEYETVVLGHPGMSFGLVGALVAAADMQSKTNQLTAVIEPKELRLQDRFVTKLSENLKKAGYTTQVVPLPKEVNDDQAVDYVKKNAVTDAVLAVKVRGSYLAAGPSSDYFPYIFVNVKKMHAQTGAILYEDNFTYGYTMQNMQTVHFASDSSYRFATIDILTADPAKTRQALIAGIDSIVEQIALDLKKN
jgi:PBP1b-binding outer membrane lipoprotein LpoB